MSNLPQLSENFRIEGVWWTPDNPDRRFTGILEYTSENAVLNLWGSFKDITEFNQQVAPEIILGNSIDGEKLTLSKISELGSTLGSGGFRSRYIVIHVFRGIHFNKKEDIKFKNVTVRFSNFDNWLAISGFQITPNLETGGMEIKHTPPSLIPAIINDFYKIIISFRVSHSISHKDIKDVHLTQTGVTIIESKEEKPFTEFLKVQHHLRNFLSLAMMSPCYPLFVIGRVEDSKLPNGYSDVGIFYSHKAPQTMEGIHDLHMLFRFHDISANFEQYLKNWFDKVETLEPVFNLYFGTFYNSDMYLDHMFLNTVQSVESYHRRTMTNKIWSEDEFMKIQEEATNCVSDKYKEWVKNKFQYGNEPSLRKRIKELLDAVNEVLGEFSIYNYEFIDDVVNTRNYLTHYDPTLKEKSLTIDQALFDAIQKLRAIMEVCFMMQLGIPNENMKNIMKRSLQNKLLIPIP